jgi:hypothetical protein
MLCPNLVLDRLSRIRTIPCIALFTHCEQSPRLGARLPVGARRSGDILAGNPLRAAPREYAVASAWR